MLKYDFLCFTPKTSSLDSFPFKKQFFLQKNPKIYTHFLSKPFSFKTMMATAYAVPVVGQMPTIMETNLEKLSSLLIDLETVNEERLAVINKQLNNLLTFETVVVDQQRHLKLDKIKNCIVIPGIYANNEMRYDIGIRRESLDQAIYESLYKMTELYSARKKDHTSLVEKCKGDYYVPLEEIELYIESLDDFIKEERDKIASFAPTVCMLRGCKKGFAYRFPSQLPGEEGKEKVMCLDCQFAFFDKNIIETLSKEDLCVNTTAKEEGVERKETIPKKRKVDTLSES